MRTGLKTTAWSRRAAVLAALAGALVLALPLSAQSEPDRSPIASAPAPKAPAGAVRQPEAAFKAPKARCAAGTAHVEISISFEEIRADACLPVSSDNKLGSRVDPTLSAISAQLIDWANNRIPGANREPSIVVCWSWSDWGRLSDLYASRDFSLAGIMGFVSGPKRTISLGPETCERLSTLTSDEDPAPNSVVAKAIGVLAHESLHTAGVSNEAAAECYSLQLTERVAAWLGGDAGYAHESSALNWQYFEDFWRGTMYEDAECRQGGELDLGLERDVWPTRPELFAAAQSFGH